MSATIPVAISKQNSAAAWKRGNFWSSNIKWVHRRYNIKDVKNDIILGVKNDFQLE